LSYDFTDKEKDELRGAHNAAFVGAVLSYYQDAPLDHAMFYRGDAAWMGLFDLEGRYFKPAYTFAAMGKMQETPRRLAVEGADSFGFAALAGRSADGKRVQIFLSNYAIPAGYKDKGMPMPADVALPPPAPDAKPERYLAGRTDIVYRDNAGYHLTIDKLPWGKGAFSIKRYRISKSQNMELVEEQAGSGGSLKLSHPLPVDTIELIVLERR
jgi:hypothetical protein